MTALVTGAAGFLGSHLIDLLLERGERPRGLVRPGDPEGALLDAGVDVYRGDIADRAALEEALAGVDRVLHCAARTGPWGPQAEFDRTNVLGLETLVRAAAATGVARVVHVSSIVVHGTDVRGGADEHAPLREESNPYSRSKIAAERLLDRIMREDRRRVTIVRPGWIYGPRDAASFGRIAERIERGGMFLLGRGDNHLPLVYVGDVAQGVLLASEVQDAGGETYLLVNDEPVTQRQFLTAIATELGAPPPRRRIPYHAAVAAGATAETAGHLARLRHAPPLTRFGVQLLGGENRFIIDRARHELGFSPSVDLAEGVRRSVAWYRATHRGAEPQAQDMAGTSAKPWPTTAATVASGRVNEKAGSA
jgi:nucleoside-diphosphate-sugar epimerase